MAPAPTNDQADSCSLSMLVSVLPLMGRTVLPLFLPENYGAEAYIQQPPLATGMWHMTPTPVQEISRA